MIILDGFVHERTGIKVYEFDWGTKYEFTALIFDADLVGFKVNFPQIFDKQIKINDRVRITMMHPIERKGWYIIRPTDTMENLGPSKVTDPYKEYTFVAGYVTNPCNGIVSVHEPKEIEKVDIVRVPVDLIEDIDESKYSTWKVKAIRVVHAVTVKEGILYSLTVKEILETIPTFKTMTYEKVLKDIRYDQRGIYVKIPEEEIFIENKDLPFKSNERINLHKRKLIGKIQLSIKYRLTGRWNIHKSADETKWKRIGIEKIEMTDQVALKQIKRFSTEEEI